MGVVSHDLRNPLSAIQMCTELFPTDDPQLARSVAIIKRSVDVMVRLISDLRDVGSIEAGHLSIRTRPEASAALVRDAIDGIKEKAAEKSLHLAVKMPTPDRVLDCDRIRIIQVLTNLLMHSDGLTTRADISEELQLLRRHPVVIAAHLLEHFGRSNDDALVLVTR